MSRIIISIYDSFNNPYYSGGGPIVVHEVAKRLQKKHEITILTGNFPGAKKETIDGIQYERIGLPDRLSSLTSYQFLLPFEVIKRKYDVWIESFTPPYSTAFLPLFTRKPVIGLAHILSGDIMKSKYGLPFDMYERAGLKLYINIITPTEQIAESIQAASPNTKVHVIPNGIDTIDFSPVAPKEEYFLFLGRLDWHQKGLDMLVKAYALVKDSIVPKLYIAGQGSDTEVRYLTNLIHNNNLQDRIILKGRVAGDEKYSLIGGAEFLTIPSRYEGMSLVALEAFMFKKTIVCFDIPGFEWVQQREYVLKAEPFHVHDFAQMLVVLANEKKMRDEMGERCYNLTKNYSWETTAAAFDSVIDQITVIQ